MAIEQHEMELRFRILTSALIPLVILALCGCESGSSKQLFEADGPVYLDGDSEEDDESERENQIADPVSITKYPGCADLISDVCIFPFPSMVHLNEDEMTETGFKLAITEEMWPVEEQKSNERQEFLNKLNSADGFSPATPLLAIFPSVHVDEKTLPDPGNLETSIRPESAVQILDRRTGQRLPVWAEMDNYATDPENSSIWLDNQRSMIIRPQTALNWNCRYTVVITDSAKDDRGNALPSPEAMRHLLSGEMTDSPQIERQREQYEDLFGFLEEHGIERGKIVLTWEFHTMSRSFAQSPLRAVIAAAKENMPRNFEFSYTCLSSVQSERDFFACDEEQDLHSAIWRRIEGTVMLPSFLDENGLIRWENGKPVYQGSMELPFVAVLPDSVRDAEAGSIPTLQIGHGLMSTTWRYLMTDADENGTLKMLNRLAMAGVGFDLYGLSTGELASVMDMIGNFNRLWGLHDRLLQGMANYSLLIPFVANSLGHDPIFSASNGESLIDSGRNYYYGVSLGGIAGAVHMALSEHIESGVLHVPSAFFSSLLQHSHEFLTFQLFLDMKQSDRRTQQILLAISQRAFDPIEPVNWRENFFDISLTALGSKNLLWQVSFNDSNAPDFGMYALARSIGIPLVTPSPQQVYGISTTIEAPSPPGSSGLAIYDTGMQHPGYSNADVPDNGAHFAIRCIDEVHNQIADFLDDDSEGRITLHCDGPCFVDGVDCRTELK